MKRFLLVLAGICGLAVTGMAGPCGAGSLQDYINLGAGGCSLGGLTVFNFNTAPGQSFASPIDPAQVSVVPTANGFELGLQQGAAAGELAELFFRFSAGNPQLVRAGIRLLDAAASGDGVVTGTQDICAGGAFPGADPTGCTGTPDVTIAFKAAGASGLYDSRTFAPVSFFDIFTDLSIDGGLNGTAGLGGAQIILVATPEPSAWILMLSGLAGLGWFRARRKSN